MPGAAVAALVAIEFLYPAAVSLSANLAAQPSLWLQLPRLQTQLFCLQLQLPYRQLQLIRPHRHYVLTVTSSADTVVPSTATLTL